MLNKNVFRILSVIVLIGLIFGAASMAHKLAGKKPTKKFDNPRANYEEEFQNFLDPLRQAADNDPRNVKLLEQYIMGLEKIVAVKFIPVYAEELAGLYEKLIELEPERKKTDLALKLADVYFNLKKFDLAERSYRELITSSSNPEELRGRLASSLSFQGKYKDSIEQLNEILKSNPRSFQGLAYLAITYAQMNEKDKALEYGKRALEQAPSAEAKARFSSFLTKLDPKTVVPETLTDKVFKFMSAHEILQSKFIRSMILGDTLNIYLQKFPIEHMPEVAKEKLFSRLKELVAGEPTIKKIVLKDQINDLVLATLEVN